MLITVVFFFVEFKLYSATLADSIYLDLYYEVKEDRDYIVSSPVPKNENWRYWQKINYSDKDFINVFTPFVFYSGDHGLITNNEKSWID